MKERDNTIIGTRTLLGKSKFWILRNVQRWCLAKDSKKKVALNFPSFIFDPIPISALIILVERLQMFHTTIYFILTIFSQKISYCYFFVSLELKYSFKYFTYNDSQLDTLKRWLTTVAFLIQMDRLPYISSSLNSWHTY